MCPIRAAYVDALGQSTRPIKDTEISQVMALFSDGHSLVNVSSCHTYNVLTSIFVAETAVADAERSAVAMNVQLTHCNTHASYNCDAIISCVMSQRSMYHLKVSSQCDHLCFPKTCDDAVILKNV